MRQEIETLINYGVCEDCIVKIIVCRDTVSPTEVRALIKKVKESIETSIRG